MSSYPYADKPFNVEVNIILNNLTTNKMALINVRLRIVGLYFNHTVRIEDARGLTVRDVLDEYIRLNPNLAVPGGLEYQRFPVLGNNNDFVTAFVYHFSGNYDFDGNNVILMQPTGPDGTSLGDNERREGIYKLAESFEDDGLLARGAGLVWQYYVVSAAGVVKSATPVTRKFQGFGEKKLEPLPVPPVVRPQYDFVNGDTIIWRLVAIARQPSPEYILAPNER